MYITFFLYKLGVFKTLLYILFSVPQIIFIVFIYIEIGVGNISIFKNFITPLICALISSVFLLFLITTDTLRDMIIHGI